jgi:tRNA(Ile)-lysidine synthase TilS/MesJ
MAKELEYYKAVERSIQKTYHKRLWTPFVAAIKKYELVQGGDRIAVCISGGKDSMLLAKMMQIFQRYYSDVRFDLTYLVMDPGYAPENRRQIEENAEKLHIPVTIFETDIFDVAYDQKENPCYLCARMRRGNLYAKAREMGCNKIALGHHFNDVIETTMIGMLYGSQLQGMMPKLHSTNFAGMELIRPLYLIHEDDIIAWKNYNHLEFLQCACRFTEEHYKVLYGMEQPSDRESESKRLQIKLLLKELEAKDPGISQSIFNSIHAVCLDTFPGYKSKGETHFFLDGY